MMKNNKPIIIDHGSIPVFRNSIYDENIINNEKIRKIVLDYFIAQKLTCFLKFGTIRENLKKNLNKKEITGYATCGYTKDHIKKYYFNFEKVCAEKYILSITSEGEEVVKHTSKPKFRQLRGNERKQFQKECAIEPIELIHMKQTIGKDPQLAEDGNTQSMFNKHVLIKARSEYRAKDDLVKNCDIADLFAQFDLQDPKDLYIQKVSYPMEAQLYSQSQLDLLVKAPQHLFYDATGNLARPPTCHDHFIQRCYYYAGVIKMNNKIIPIMELITVKHDTATLIGFLTNVMAKIQANVPRINKPFLSITIDWSWPSIHAFMKSVNNITFLAYLNIKFYKKNVETTPLFICYSHFCKIISTQINKRFSNNYLLSGFLKNVFRILANCSNMEEIEKFFWKFVFICSNEYKNDDVQTKFDEFSNMLDKEPKFDENDDDEIIEEWKEEFGPNTKDPLYKKSPYYEKFLKIYESIQKLISNDHNNRNQEKNVLFAKDFCVYVIKHYMPYIIIWNYGIINERKNNSLAENHFKNMKHIYATEKNYKIGRFINICKDTLKLLLNYIQFNKVFDDRKYLKRKAVSNTTDEDEEGLNTNSHRKLSFKNKEENKEKCNILSPSPISNDHKLSSQNVSHYTSSKENFVLGVYKYAPFKIYNTDFQSLNGLNDRMLDDSIIDITSQILLEDSMDCAYLDSIATREILFNENDASERFNYIKNLNLIGKQILFCPLVSHNHWNLLVFYLKTGKAYKLSSINKHEVENEKMIKVRFQDVFKLYNKMHNSTIKTRLDFSDFYDVAQQITNSNDCGIFVMHFIEQIMKSLNFSGLEQEFNTTTYRKKISQLLLDYPEDVSNACLKCGENLLEVITNWISCVACSRWIHFKCCNEDEEVMNSENYKCFLCI